MTTLKERFEKDFHKGFVSEESILSFFRQELLALAEEVEEQATNTRLNDLERASGLEDAATLIRSKANELV